VRKSVCACPVARAMARALARTWLIGKGGRTAPGPVRVDWYERHPVNVQLPDEVVKWIGEFDTGKRPAPFEFDVEIPEEYLGRERPPNDWSR